MYMRNMKEVAVDENLIRTEMHGDRYGSLVI
jgi:hypothetical protein